MIDVVAAASVYTSVPSCKLCLRIIVASVNNDPAMTGKAICCTISGTGYTSKNYIRIIANLSCHCSKGAGKAITVTAT